MSSLKNVQKLDFQRQFSLTRIIKLCPNFVDSALCLLRERENISSEYVPS